jgi:hypothetical protein
MKKQIKQTVWCSLQFEGFHKWEACPHEEVNYLRQLHRHLFHVKAWVNVTHGDRDVEFIILKHRIQEYIVKQYPTGNLGNMSCEMLAMELIEHFDLCACEVSEDGENGCYLEVSDEH